jgi:stage II sporulation protein GA (sporulation sigma-E factor processing peptidase)
MKIYLDVFFLVNACMNMIVLVAECMFKKQRMRLRRLILASATGAALAVVILVSGIHTYKILFIPLYFMGLLAVVYIAFGKTSFPAFVGNVVIFFVMSSVLAALIWQLQSIVGYDGKITMLLLGSALFMGCLYWLLPFFSKRKNVYEKYYRIWIVYRDRKISGTGLLDTGNHLFEPFTQEPVTIAEKTFLSVLWQGDSVVFRHIPYHSIGNEGDFMEAFRADEIWIEDGRKKKWKIQKPWVAIAGERICTDKEYQVILHPDMMSGHVRTVKNHI